MKFNSRLLLPVLAVAASMCCGAAVAEGYDVYLLIGQSNMSGRGKRAGTDPWSGL